MQPRTVRLVLVMSGVASIALLACGALLDLEAPPAGAQDAGTDAPSIVDATSNDAAPPLITQCPVSDAGGCGTRYVNALTGNDSNDGCTEAMPMKSIKAAVGAFETNDQAGYTVCVCGSATYAESSLKLDISGSLLGAFNCNTWSRTAMYGYPNFDGANETTITNAAPSDAENRTLTIGSLGIEAGAPSQILVDGFTFLGADNLATSIAVESNLGATLSNSKAIGGVGTTISYGVLLTSASVEVANDSITSGPAPLTVGVQVTTTGPAPNIHDSAIKSGTSTGTGSSAGSYGLFLTGNPVPGSGAVNVQHNTITAGTGESSSGVFVAEGVSANVTGNLIQCFETPGGLSDGGPQPSGLSGVRSQSTGNIRVIGNRINGGGITPGFGHFEGILILSAPSPVVTNNMVYGGLHESTEASPGGVTGIKITTSTSPIIASNTIYTGYAGGGLVAFAIMLNAGTTGAVVQNNVIAGSGLNDYSLSVDECTNEVAALEHNLFFGAADGVLNAAACVDGGVIKSKDISGISTFLNGPSLDGNLIATNACSAADTDAGACIASSACATSPACLASVFAAWSAADNGYTTWGTTGWLLSPTNSCLILRGGLDLSTTDAGFSVATDFFGNPRNPNPSLGAAELLDASCN